MFGALHYSWFVGRGELLIAAGLRSGGRFVMGGALEGGQVFGTSLEVPEGGEEKDDSYACADGNDVERFDSHDG